MKKQIFVKVLIAILVLQGCNKFEDDAELNSNENLSLRIVGEGILNIEYDITTFKDYDTDFSKLSTLDLASVNPSDDKQHVKMVLLESGQLNIEIEEVEFEHKVKINHKTLPNDSKQIKITKIIGNVANFYDANNKLLKTERIEIPNHIETVKKINELGNKFSAEDINSTISTMQGQQFIDNLEQFISNAEQNGAQVVEQGNGFVTLRMNFNKIDPLMRGSSVVLIDKSANKMVGCRNYDAENKLVQSVLYAYKKGDVESLSAIQITQNFTLPSQKEIKMITSSKIENLKFNVNK